jgi:hypothetical protein
VKNVSNNTRRERWNAGFMPSMHSGGGIPSKLDRWVGESLYHSFVGSNVVSEIPGTFVPIADGPCFISIRCTACIRYLHSDISTYC